MDANQTQITRELRQIGLSVLVLSSIGSGCPDILVGSLSPHGCPIGLLVELKASAGDTLTDDEADFLLAWKGPKMVAWTTEQILEEIERLQREQTPRRAILER